MDVEVVGTHPALLTHELEPGSPGVGRTVLAAEDELELLGGDDGHDPEAALVFGPVEIGTHVVKLAVVRRERSGFFRCRIGIPRSSANAFTSRRNRLPIWFITAGEGTGFSRWSGMNANT